MNFKKIWTGIAITAISLSGFVGVGAANAAPPEPTETNAINDYELKKFLNTQYFGNPADTNITAEQLGTLTEIDNEDYHGYFTEEEAQKDANDGSYGYMDISGLRYATNLKTLNLSDVDIDPGQNPETSKAVYEELNYLTNLKSLSLESTGLYDPVDYGFSDDFTLNLPNLTYLNLNNNDIDDSIYFISELNNLEELYLGGNSGGNWNNVYDDNSDDIVQTLSGLDNVQKLDLSYNGLDNDDEYLVDSVMDMDSLNWFNFEGNSANDLRAWKPVADKVVEFSFANQQLSAHGTRFNLYDGSVKYDFHFYEGTYDFNKGYDIDGIEYTLKNSGNLLYDNPPAGLFTYSNNVNEVGVMMYDRTFLGSGRSYNIDQVKEINQHQEFYYGFGEFSNRGSFAYRLQLTIKNEIGILPTTQNVNQHISDYVETEPLTLLNSDATVIYSTNSKLPNGLTLNPNTGVISGTPTEVFYGQVLIIPTLSSKETYNAPIVVNIDIYDSIPPSVGADLPDGKVGVEYNGSITTDSGNITNVEGLPDGLTYNYDTGVVSGVPTVDGEFGVLVNVVKDGNSYNGFNETIVILPADPEIITPVITSDLPDGKVGDNYDGSIISEPGSITNVDGLPDGLTFDSNTGRVNGVPTKAGEFNVNITADNQGVKNNSVETIVIAHVPVDDKPSTEPTPTPAPDSEDPNDNTNNTPLDPSPSPKPVDKVDENNVDNNDNLSTPVDKSKTIDKEHVNPTDKVDENNVDNNDNLSTPMDKSKTVDKEHVNPVDKVVKKINSGEIIDEYSLPIFSVLSIMFGLGLLVVILKLRKKNN